MIIDGWMEMERNFKIKIELEFSSSDEQGRHSYFIVEREEVEGEDDGYSCFGFTDHAGNRIDPIPIADEDLWRITRGLNKLQDELPKDSDD